MSGEGFGKDEEIEGFEEEESEEKSEVTGERFEIVEKPRLITCRVCGEKIELKNYMTHLKENHPEEFESHRRKVGEGIRKSWTDRKEKTEEVIRKARKVEEMPPEQLVALFGREGLDELKLRRLIDMLDIAPNVTSSQKRWIEQRWKTYERMRNDPQELFRVLKDEAGIKDKIASAIVQAVFSLESEYADILARKGEPVFTPMFKGEPSEIYPFGLPPRYGRPQYESQPQWYHQYPPAQYTYPMAPPYLGYREREREGVVTREELHDILNKWFSEKFEKRQIDEKIEFLRNAIEGVKDYVEELKHEIEKKLLMKSSEEKGKPPLEVELLSAKLEEAHHRIDEMASQISSFFSSLEKKEKEKLEAEIKSLKESQKELLRRIDELRPTGEYSSDTYRLLSEIAREAKHRRPLETIARILFPEKFPVHLEKLPSSSPLPPAIESELRAAGLLERYGG